MYKSLVFERRIDKYPLCEYDMYTSDKTLECTKKVDKKNIVDKYFPEPKLKVNMSLYVVFLH